MFLYADLKLMLADLYLKSLFLYAKQITIKREICFNISIAQSYLTLLKTCINLKLSQRIDIFAVIFWMPEIASYSFSYSLSSHLETSEMISTK